MKRPHAFTGHSTTLEMRPAPQRLFCISSFTFNFPGIVVLYIILLHIYLLWSAQGSIKSPHLIKLFVYPCLWSVHSHFSALLLDKSKLYRTGIFTSRISHTAFLENAHSRINPIIPTHTFLRTCSSTSSTSLTTTAPHVQQPTASSM